MTEEEKIFSGHMFNNRSQVLVDMKHKAHSACRRYNQLDEYDPQRLPIIKECIGAIGDTYYFQGPIQFNYGCHTFIGENFFANFNLTIMDDARIYIGNNVCFGPNVSLMATNHPLLPQERLGLDKQGNMTMAEYAREIHIGNNVWLACNVTVLGGVHIGSNAVIGAGSVVTKDIPDNYLAYGNPCRAIRPITENDSKKHLILPEDAKHFKYNLT
ncbi:acetyltransferase [Megasphaera cerevisiae DSM 20462]|jgi:acetyltransferase-like isoleucine patch superfamily enzyme|uniref:Acetyltransferase n=1 Tax=Megasphaera cerevisiae DSM 20462 TaxID=1122219 RepID=A0A0J6WR35_9FIRM|nr:sugar O-acetyltransferase [Megasphaera cerevisiae]KMO85915.1 acetyltransferase [Megasphaera cerevisiae DSM 20462]OKY54440.1 acetyltransferase [Megasphaera cerevisiae]SKA08578.1 Maltose acetyltransferase [Megasphaera cerevisiae DSM 20462]